MAVDILNMEKRTNLDKLKKTAKGKKDDSEDKPKVIHKTRFTIEDFHYAEFSDNGVLRFLKYRNGQTETVNSVEITDPEDPEKKYTVSPAPQIAQTKNDRILNNSIQDVIKFPSKPMEYNGEYGLYKEIKAFIHAHVELKIEDEILLSLYIMKATLYDALKDSSFPFIHIIAPYGKGKSRLLTVLCEATPYGFYAIDIKSAPLKRVSELYQVILFVDEKSDMDNETSAIINAKYNRNSVVLNASKEIQQGFSSIIGYSIYGPMVLAGRSPFKDDAIESKSLQINMDFSLSRHDIPRKIKGDAQDSFLARASEIRGKLLQFRINWHDRINEVKASGFLSRYEDKTEPRLYEVISFFEDMIEIMPELKPEIQNVLITQIIRNVEVAKETPNGMVADIVLTLIESEENSREYMLNGKSHTGICLSAIYDEIGKDYAKQAGKILSTLGLKTDRPRLEFTRKGKNGDEEQYRKKVSMIRIPGEKKLNELRSRYDPEFVKSNLSAISLDGQAILDDEDDEDDDMGNAPPENDSKIDKKLANTEDEQTKNEAKNRGHSNNDSPHRPDSPELKGEPTQSDVQNEKPKFYKYRVLKNFKMYGRVYNSGIDFVLTDYLESDLKNGNLELLEGEP
ncbi:MAG: hypothetical protein M1476_03330 [Candidatus Thermoplasmatota archaeon]|nr:hypothetical protein [Candidatus Thermoplasmatota archaeon]